MRPETIDDLFLIVGMVLIAWGFWDPSRLILIFGGALIIFVVLKGGDNDGNQEQIIGRP